MEDRLDKKSMRTVIYCRVSSNDQVKGYSLQFQKEECIKYCEKNGWEIAKIFMEEGESAKTENRTKLHELLEFCRKNKGKIDFLVVYKIDRFSRSVDAHHFIKAKITDYNISLKSVTEQIDDTPAGKLIENVLAANAQFDNDIRATQASNGMRSRLKDGKWCWVAPVGLKNITIADQKTITLDEQAPLIKRLYEEASTGLYTDKQLAKKANRWGLRSKKDKKITPQMVFKILTNKLYMGVGESKKWGIEVELSCKKVVKPELWHRVQAVRAGKTVHNAPRSRRNPVFPLRAFISCGNCGRRLTGSLSRGRNKRYPYYRCHNPACKSPSIPKTELEDKFLTLLKKIKPSKRHVELFKAVVLDVWKKKHENIITKNQRIKNEIQKLEGLKSSLIRKGVEGVISDEDLSSEVSRIKDEIVVKKVDLKESEISEVELEEILNRAENFLLNVGTFWRDAQLDQKQRFQQLVFPKGVVYNYCNFETAEISPIYEVIRESDGVKTRLVAPTGIEPVFPP